jgi:hypothetical protein
MKQKNSNMLDAKTIDMNFMLILWVFFLLIFRVFCVNSERLGDLFFFSTEGNDDEGHEF